MKNKTVTLPEETWTLILGMVAFKENVPHMPVTNALRVAIREAK